MPALAQPTPAAADALLAVSAQAGVEVHGHRGARALFPENTLAGFREALRAGVDVLELDLGVTRDGVLVVAHDQELDPALCLGPDGTRLQRPVPLRSLTLAELKRYDCGTLLNPRFPRQKPAPGERVPTLEEVFRLLAESPEPAARTARLNVETKSFPARPELAPPPEEFARLLLAAAKRAGLLERLIVQSFDHRTLAAVKRLRPSTRVSALISDNLPDLLHLARGLGAEIVSPHHEWITADEVRRLREAGVRVIPWTVNDEPGWRRMLEPGVDGIITDDPPALIGFLKEKGLR